MITLRVASLFSMALLFAAAPVGAQFLTIVDPPMGSRVAHLGPPSGQPTFLINGVALAMAEVEVRTEPGTCQYGFQWVPTTPTGSATVNVSAGSTGPGSSNDYQYAWSASHLARVAGFSEAVLPTNRNLSSQHRQAFTSSSSQYALQMYRIDVAANCSSVVDFSASVTVRATAELYRGLGAALAEGQGSIVSEATGESAAATVRALIANTPISVGSVGWSGSISLPLGGGLTGTGGGTSFSTILVGSLGQDNREDRSRARGWAADSGEIVSFTSEVTLDSVARVLGMAQPSIVKAWIDRSEIVDTHGFVRCLPQCGGGITWTYRSR